jgi:ribosomal protein S18 acetylase RimI-like enzyme
VRYRAAGTPRNACYCHCESCRRASGGATVAWFSVDTAAFAVTQGRLAVRESSPGVTRGHCARCGSSITYHNAARAGDMDVTIASLDEPHALRPQVHLWVQDKPAWLALDDGLPRYATVPGHWDVRAATAGDAPALAVLAERCFRDTYAAGNTATDMDAHCARNFGAAQQAIEIADPATVTLLAEVAGALVAYAQLRLAAAPPCVSAARPAEILRFYVDRGWHGNGLARSLMHALLDAARARGRDVAWLGVWERNQRAQAFYRKCGFVEAGTHVFTLGADPQRDLVLVQRLA